jgi:hypothetical protein
MILPSCTDGWSKGDLLFPQQAGSDAACVALDVHELRMH